MYISQLIKLFHTGKANQLSSIPLQLTVNY